MDENELIVMLIDSGNDAGVRHEVMMIQHHKFIHYTVHAWRIKNQRGSQCQKLNDDIFIHSILDSIYANDDDHQPSVWWESAHIHLTIAHDDDPRLWCGRPKDKLTRRFPINIESQSWKQIKYHIKDNKRLPS